MNAFKLWQRWDPRLGPAPLRAAKRVKQWLIEVVPDVFAPGQEKLREEVLKTIGAVKGSQLGRWLLRTAHPAEAVATLRWLHEVRGHYPYREETPNRVVLAVYAETQAELVARVAELRAPRVLAEELALKDVDAALALAKREGAISDLERSEVKEAKAKGPEAVSALLRQSFVYSRRTSCLGPDTGGLALYLSPREPIDVAGVLAPVERGERGWIDSQRAFEWVIVAGQVGPLGKGGIGPWPLHPTWVTNVAVAARAAKTPFCVPYLGEWTGYDSRVWEGDHTVSGGMSSSDAVDGVPGHAVDFDPDWKWGERGWDDNNYHAKPSSAYMEAIGSKLVGRTLVGRTFDEWPSWYPR